MNKKIPQYTKNLPDMVTLSVSILQVVIACIAAISIFSPFERHMNQIGSWKPDFLSSLGHSHILPAILVTLTSGFAGIALSYWIASVLHQKKRSGVTIFVSHSQSDQELASELIEQLRDAGYNVLDPETSINAGDSIEKSLREMLENSDLVLPILSSNSTSSRWVSKEIDMALQQHKKIVPIMTDQKDIKIPLGLADIKGISLASSIDFAADITKALDRIAATA